MKNAHFLCVLPLLLTAAPTGAQVCEACDPAIEVTRAHLDCIEQRLDGFIREAAVTDPLLVDLTVCDGGTAAAPATVRGELPCIGRPGEGEDCGAGPAQPAPVPDDLPVFFFLSRAQLICLRGNLAALREADGSPVRFDFATCEPAER